MSRRAAVAASAALLLAVGTAQPAAGHGIGGTFQLPVPLWLYLAGAAAAVAASFVVITLASRDASATAAYPTRPLPAVLAGMTRIALRVLGIAWWYGAIAAGVTVGDISPLPAVLLWIGIWVGLPIVAVLAGNAWPSLSPFRTSYTVLAWLAARGGVDRLDLGLRYPPWLARWPAVALLAAAIWSEQILPGRNVAGSVAALMIGYTLLTLAGMLSFGPVSWLRHAELFEVELGWFGRIGPLARRVRSAEVCDGCEERCDRVRCIDCADGRMSASLSSCWPG